jgi:hypothetical protein
VPEEINVGCSQAELDRLAKAHLGIDGPVYGRGYVGLAIWEHLVRGAGSMDADAVMEQAQKESGDVVTMFGPMHWKPNGDAEAAAGWMDGVSQFQRHPVTGELQAVTVSGDAADGGGQPMLTRLPYERRPPPWGARA